MKAHVMHTEQNMILILAPLVLQKSSYLNYLAYDRTIDLQEVDPLPQCL
jgi:hypothetical protein